MHPEPYNLLQLKVKFVVVLFPLCFLLGFLVNIIYIHIIIRIYQENISVHWEENVGWPELLATCFSQWNSLSTQVFSLKSWDMWHNPITESFINRHLLTILICTGSSLARKLICLHKELRDEDGIFHDNIQEEAEVYWDFKRESNGYTCYKTDLHARHVPARKHPHETSFCRMSPHYCSLSRKERQMWDFITVLWVKFTIHSSHISETYIQCKTQSTTVII